MRARSFVLILCLGFSTAAAHAQLSTESVTLRSFDGRSVHAELGHLSVPSSHSSPGKKFEIAYYRLPSEHPGNEVPIVFLMGGPGVSATFIAQVPPYFDLFSRLSKLAPVILLDQRGTGLSRPKVDCPAGFKPPADLFTTPRTLLDTYASSYAACAKYWSLHDVSPDDFAIEEIADDIEDLRSGLGVPKVDLLALSFGTRIALEVVRRHPQSVRRMVLQGTVTPDGLVRLPSQMDDFFLRTAEEARSQAAAKGLDADLVSTFRKVKEELQQKPMAVRIKTQAGEDLTVTLGPDSIATLVATRTTDTRLPALLTSLAHGDSSVVALILQSVYQDLEGGAGSMMAHSVSCTATDSTRRLEIAKTQSSKSVVGEPFDNAMVADDFCRKIHVTRRSKSTPAPAGEMPALFINGNLDDRTPVQLAEDARKGFVHGSLIVVSNGCHELLPEEAVQKIVADFLAGKNEPGATFSLPRREFATIAEAANPPKRPR